MLKFRQWFRIDRYWVKCREANLIAQEDAAIRLALESATTLEERAFVERDDRGACARNRRRLSE